jgi:CRISPR-associated protein Csb1
MSVLTVDRLVAAMAEDRRDAGIVVTGRYQPVGGAGGKVMPPTFPEGPYLFEERWVDGQRLRTVVVDQVPSQANRVEEALSEARRRGRIAVPVFELTAPTELGVVRLTSLEFPHRYADAYLRDSEVGGRRFDASEVGGALRGASADDVRPLYHREPYSLIFGAWDSHRRGRWPKFARLYSSSLFGLDPIVGDRRGGRMDPLNLTGAVDDKNKASGDWVYRAEGEKVKGGKLSEIGHGNIAPSAAHGGVTVTEVRRQAWLSFAGLERLRFGDASGEAARLARAALAALALAGDRLAFGRPSLWLRSGCDLTRHAETMAFERDGGELEPFELTAAQAVDVFTELRGRAAAAGVVMATDTVVVTPTRALADAIAFSVMQAPADAGE